jgi:hypothetical protein
MSTFKHPCGNGLCWAAAIGLILTGWTATAFADAVDPDTGLTADPLQTEPLPYPLAMVGSDAQEATAISRNATPKPWDPEVWAINVYGSGAIAQDGDIASGHIGVSYNPATDFTVTLEFVGGYIFAKSPSEDAGIIALDLMLKYHMWHGEDWSIFFEGGCGIAWMTEEFPFGGTDYVFRPQVGAGFNYRLDQNIWLNAGVRWLHMSNADIEGDENNPGYDSIMFYAGVTIPF